MTPYLYSGLPRTLTRPPLAAFGFPHRLFVASVLFHSDTEVGSLVIAEGLEPPA